MIIWSASAIGAAWVVRRRRLYRRQARPLDEAQQEALAPWFGRSLLERTRIARVDRIDNPLVYALFPLVGCRPPMDLGMVSGMAFADTVVIARPKRDVDPDGLLFHELVHIAQYDLLGVHSFVRAYLRGWLEGGRDYFAIPLEQQAYAMQRRFTTSSEVFSVQDELRWMLTGV